MSSTLGASGTSVPHEILRHDARHGFHCDARDGHFQEASTADVWQKTLDWLEQHLQ